MRFDVFDIHQKEEIREDILDEELVSEITTKFEEGKSARIERENEWKKYLDAYYLKYISPSPTFEWRSKSIPPKSFYLTEQFISTIRRSLKQSQDFFSLTSLAEDANIKLLSIVLKRLAEFYLKSYNFFEEFENALRWGVITGEIIMRVIWKREVKVVGTQAFETSYPDFKAISPFDYIEDEFKRWACERYFVDLNTIYKLQQLYVWRDFPLEPFAPETDKKLEEFFEKSFLDLAKKEGLAEVIEFWGDLYFKDNKILKNQHIVIVNRKHLALVETRKFFHNSIPFVHTHLFEPLRGNWGYGIFDIIYDLLKTYTDTWRVLEDSFKLAMGTVIEINEAVLKHDTKEQIRKEGLVPFALLWKTGEGDAMQGKNYVNFNPNVLPFLQLQNQELQNATGITEFLMGLPTSKGRPTAREVMIKTQQNIAMMDLITTRIEQKILSELIRKLVLLIIENEEIEKIRNIVGQEGVQIFSTLSREEIARLTEERLTVSVWGLSEVMHRQEKIDKLLTMLDIGQNLPDLNIKGIIEKIANLFGFLPTEIITPPPPPEAIQQQNLVLTQLATLILAIYENKENAIELLLEKFPPEIVLSALQNLLQQQQGRR